jgi:hypothetical protein
MSKIKQKSNKIKKDDAFEHAECASDIDNNIFNILESDKRGSYSDRIYYIAKSIASRQSSDIDIASSLSIIIDGFNDEMINYREIMSSQNKRVVNSFAKFIGSNDKEIEIFNNRGEKKRSIN